MSIKLQQYFRPNHKCLGRAYDRVVCTGSNHNQMCFKRWLKIVTIIINFNIRWYHLAF